MNRIKIFLLTFCLVFSNVIAVSAYTDLGNGYVQLEYGDSYGSIGAAYDINYYNLGYYNGQNPDVDVVHPGDVIKIGYASADNYFYGTGESYSYDYTPDYGYSENSYSIYYEDEYSGTISDYSYNDYTPTYTDSYSYTPEDVSYDSVYGYASYGIGYYGDAATNVSRACELNNNITIPAGGTYRASDYIKSGSYDMGFVDAPGLMSDGSTPLMPGSGICPVTTYIYKAGKDAGLNIVEHNDHSGKACAYAEAGEQAMYNYGTSDLVMTNPYDHDITLQCSYINGQLTAVWVG